jgi:hypothetical protein
MDNNTKSFGKLGSVAVIVPHITPIDVLAKYPESVSQTCADNTVQMNNGPTYSDDYANCLVSAIQ